MIEQLMHSNCWLFHLGIIDYNFICLRSAVREILEVCNSRQSEDALEDHLANGKAVPAKEVAIAQ